MFAMDFHHIISDGTSVSVICNDIALAYDGKELEPEKFSQLDLSVLRKSLKKPKNIKNQRTTMTAFFGC